MVLALGAVTQDIVKLARRAVISFKRTTDPNTVVLHLMASAINNSKDLFWLSRILCAEQWESMEHDNPVLFHRAELLLGRRPSDIPGLTERERQRIHTAWRKVQSHMTPQENVSQLSLEDMPGWSKGAQNSFQQMADDSDQESEVQCSTTGCPNPISGCCSVCLIDLCQSCLGTGCSRCG